MTNLSYGFLSFNNWPILERTLESAKKLKHTQGGVQWVIVDKSQEEFCEEMEKNILAWMDKNQEIDMYVFFNRGNNTGEGAGMNACFDMCEGENILFFQDDWECVVDYPFIDLAIETLDSYQAVFMIHLGKRPWSADNLNIKRGPVLMVRGDITVFGMQPNQWGNNTFQVRLFKKSKWGQVGHYLEDKDMDPDWKKYGHRLGSVSERDYGIRLAQLGCLAAKINDGQFIHTIEENARMHFIKDD